MMKLRGAYAIWTSKMSCAPKDLAEFAHATEELASIFTALNATLEKLPMPIFELSFTENVRNKIVDKVSAKREKASKPNTTPVLVGMKSPTKKLQQLRKITTDVDSFQNPAKHLTFKSSKTFQPVSLPPATFQSNNLASFDPTDLDNPSSGETVVNNTAPLQSAPKIKVYFPSLSLPTETSRPCHRLLNTQCLHCETNLPATSSKLQLGVNWNIEVSLLSSELKEWNIRSSC
ncbi:hypothetical protein NPIL_562011 [Nephila pilipes]|uniref:Uncharacterized protein n=1 Tax=Nephila pilipes TaxID=299642 RepID=A0A8X6TEW9_NEPPI|nr:hypothetical protein NPIL_562011 [Nephila pilipes]